MPKSAGKDNRHKIKISLCQRTGRGSGSSFQGYIARRIDPDILSVMSRMVRKKVIAVTGTNGKTTTNSILYHALRTEGQKVLYNSMGANLLDGMRVRFGAKTPYNVYNTLSAYAALLGADAPREKFGEVIESFDYGN